MSDFPYNLNESQQAALRWIGDHAEVFGILGRKTLIEKTGLSDSEFESLIYGLESHGFVEVIPSGDKYGTSSQIQRPIAELVQRLDDQPPKDHWADSIRWFRSKPWSVPLIAIIVLIPLIQGWIASISWLIEWITKE